MGEADMRRGSRRAAFAAALTALSATSSVGAQSPDEHWELRAGAWDRSVAAEQAGRVLEADQILERGWGAQSDSYEVSVRRAWLNLKLERYEQAAELYRHAIPLPGAGPEATQGLASSLAAKGDQHLADGNTEAAISAWKTAVQTDPSRSATRDAIHAAEDRRPLRPEAWLGYAFRKSGGPAWGGWAVFAQLPVLATRSLSFPGANRHVRIGRMLPGTSTGAGRGRGSSGAEETESQTELFLGAGYEKKWFGAEVLGGTILPSYEDTGWIAASRLRAGYTWGANVTAAGVHRQFGWGGQVLPTAFVWPAPWLGLAAGPRITADPKGTAVSGFAGVTLRGKSLSAIVSGHVGTERYPVYIEAPSILTLAEDARWGGTATVMFGLSDTLQLGVQGQFERIRWEETDGAYGTVSVGLQYLPRM